MEEMQTAAMSDKFKHSHDTIFSTLITAGQVKVSKCQIKAA